MVSWDMTVCTEFVICAKVMKHLFSTYVNIHNRLMYINFKCYTGKETDKNFSLKSESLENSFAMHMQTRTHTHTHARMHTHTHTHTHTQKKGNHRFAVHCNCDISVRRFRVALFIYNVAYVTYGNRTVIFSRSQRTV